MHLLPASSRVVCNANQGTSVLSATDLASLDSALGQLAEPQRVGNRGSPVPQTALSPWWRSGARGGGYSSWTK